MQRLFYLIIVTTILCISICSCEPEKSPTSSDNTSNSEVMENLPGKENQVLTQISRRVMKNGNEVGDKTETKKYGENGKLEYYAKFDNSAFNKEEKNGVVTATLYSDEAGTIKKGKVVYTYDKANKTMQMKAYDEGEEKPAVAEYIEYLDDGFEWYTKYCMYSPQEGNKIFYYRTAVFAPGTYDYTEETDYITDLLIWNEESCEPIGELKVMQKVECEYNQVVIPGSDEKMHQWIRELHEVNEAGSSRKFQYEFLWNENFCTDNHLQQDSFELNLSTEQIISVNDIVRKTFQKYGNEYKVKRKSWISAEGETRYYYRYEYGLEPDSNSNYYLTGEDWVDISTGTEIIKNEKKYFHYKDNSGTLIYEEIILQEDSSRGLKMESSYPLSMCKRYSRGQ